MSEMREEARGVEAPVTAQRKESHVDVCLSRDVQADRLSTGLEHYRFEHAGLPEMALGDVDTSCTVFGKSVAAPLFVAPMTGGTQRTAGIVRNLAVACEELSLAMSVGSQRAAVEDLTRAQYFEVRRYAPKIPLFANLGAVQLNYGFGVDHYRRAVEMIEADALFVHVNPLQECIQEGGDTDFRGLVAKIGELCRRLGVPLIVSEVGCGFSRRTLERLRDEGVRAVCPSGGGGTSWSLVEALRASDPGRARSGVLFRNWGIPLAEAVQSARAVLPDGTVMAVGGIQDGIQIAKLVALGADLCGMARQLLAPAVESGEAAAREMRQHVTDLRIAMFCAGARSIEDLRTGGLLVRESGPLLPAER
jgi:isopentenyl-diphosphate Delta-isomerase